VVTLREAAITSARRLGRLGLVRTALGNAAMVAAFRAGVSPACLARLYRGDRAGG